MLWDVAVVGAGPAGASAALAAARAGARTLIVERATLPRYKTCAGGLMGVSLRSLPAGLACPTRAVVRRVTFTLGGRLAFTRRATGEALLHMVYREDFDAALAKEAVEAGVDIRTGVTVRRLTGHDDHVELVTDAGVEKASVVVGADGSASRVARHVGVRCDQVDLGLEAEIPLDPWRLSDWRDRVHLDWGPLPGCYGWVFPKDDGITVGVIASRRDGGAVPAYFSSFLRRLQLAGLSRRVESGHLTRCRTTDSPLRRGRVLVAGDAAGLLEPWTREGISFALRSGRLAGEVAAKALADGSPAAVDRTLDGYEERVTRSLGREMQAGREVLRTFRARPAVIHAALSTPAGWNLFVRVCRGDTALDQVLTHRLAAAGLSAVAHTRRRRQR